MAPRPRGRTAARAGRLGLDHFSPGRGPRTSDRTLFFVDRWFRRLGLATLAALFATGVFLFAEGSAWRVMFVIAHIAALLALLPLAVVLALRAARDAKSPPAVLQRYPVASMLMAALAVTVALSLANFEGNRDARRVANLSSVALILALVWRYLRWAHSPRT